MQSKFLFALLCFVTFANFFFFRSLGSFGLQLFFIGSWVFLLFLSILNGVFQHKKFVFLSSGTTLLLFSLLVISRDNLTILVLLHFTSFMLLFYTLYSIISTHPHFIALMEILCIPWLVTKNYFSTALKTITGAKQLSTLRQDVCHGPKESDKVWQNIRPILGGLLLGSPVTFLLISLFAKADPVFESVIKNIVGMGFLENMIWRSILSVVLFLLGLPVLFMKRTTHFANPINRIQRWNLVTEYSIVMLLVAATVGMFLAIQWRYIFIPSVSGVNLSQFGIQTYSEYVNKGFSELLVASVFLFGLIWLGLLLMRNKPANKVTFLKSIQFTVLVEFFVVILSVFRRIWLYQHYHGMSLVRFYGGYAVIFLLFLTTTLFLRHLFRFRFAVIELFGLIVALLGLSVMNIESYISTQHPPTVNDRIDYTYLSRLSGDGYEGWLRAYQWSDSILSKDYTQQSVINADQRREIVYAGIVLEQLMSRQQQFILESGSDEEVKAYYVAIHADALKHLDEVMAEFNALEPQIQTTANLGDTQTLRDFQYKKGLLVNARLAVQTNLDRVNAGTFSLSQAKSLLYPLPQVHLFFNSGVSLQRMSGFENVDCATLNLCTSTDYYAQTAVPNTFFSIRTQDAKVIEHKEVLLDRVFTWNPHARGVTQIIQREMPVESMLDLQQTYFKLFKRISTQSKEEQTFDVDISLDAPFLTALY